MRIGTAVTLAWLGMASLAGASESDLYEWLGTASVIVTGENLSTHGKYTEFHVRSVLRGDLAPDTVIRINVRRANRDRDRQIDREALRFEEGLTYVLLLTPSASRKPDAPPTFEFIRGVRGAREVPPEGGAVLIEAIERFIEIQARADDRYKWRSLYSMMEETNPLLIETALRQMLKFRRGRAEQLGSLRPLLDHPSEPMRERAALLIGQILDRTDFESVPDAAALQSELVSAARRDDAASVRIAATQALHGLGGDGVLPILEEVARTDPDQNVRYAAERLILERRQASAAPPGGSADRD